MTHTQSIVGNLLPHPGMSLSEDGVVEEGMGQS